MTDRTNNTQYFALAAMIAASASWAMAFCWVPIALDVMSPLPLSAIRFVSSALLAAVWLAWRRPAIPTWAEAARYAAAAFFGSVCYSVFVNMGQATVSPGAASFITNIIPILTAILAWPALGERLNGFGWLGCLLGFAGVSYIAVTQPGGLSFGAGAMFIILASIAASIYFIFQKRLIEAHGAQASTAYTLLFSGFFLLPWFPQALTEASAADLGEAVAIAGLIIFPTVVAYVGSIYALSKLPAGVTTSLLYLVAPLATLFAYLFLGDVPRLATIAGGATAIIGTAIVARWGKVTTAPSGRDLDPVGP